MSCTHDCGCTPETRDARTDEWVQIAPESARGGCMADFDAPQDVPWLVAEVERLTAEREWFKDRFPCDGACVDAPEEACSRHGRNPADLWRIIGEVAAERDALAAQVALVEALAEEWERDAEDQLRNCYSGRDVFEGERTVQIVSELRDALAGSEADTSDTQPTDQEDHE